MTKIRQMRLATLTVGALATLCQPAAAADFYLGKVLTIIVGFSAGGGYDMTARLYARHMGRHIPGNPTIVVSNMPGAGSVVATTNLFSSGPQDGTRLGIVAGGAVIEPLLGTQAKYDARKFQWIGGRSVEPSICAIWHESPVRTMQDAMKTEVIVGASGPGSRTLTYPKLLNELIGTKFKVVTGYPGSNEIRLAMERKEVGGQCGLAWGTAKTRLPDWLSEHKLTLLTQFGLTRASDLPDVPLAAEFAKTDRDRKAIEFLESDAILAWPLFAPPATPADRMAELRQAFSSMLKDPEFLADAQKQGLDVEEVPGRELQRVVDTLYATPADVLDVVKRSMAE
jgi:tripartite-type tricarboxylate transporter receptor subunit TctC